MAKTTVYLPSDISPQNSLKILTIARFTSQNPKKPQPNDINTSLCFHSQPFCSARGKGRPNTTYLTIFWPNLAYFATLSYLVKTLLW